MSLLTVVTDAMRICGLAAPSAVMTSSDDLARLFVSLLSVEGDELSQYHGWRQLKVRSAFDGDGVTTRFPLPADFSRFGPGEVFFLQDGIWQTSAQASDEEMLARQTQNVSLLRPSWRLIDNDVEFFPALNSSDNVEFEYRTIYWTTDASGDTRKIRPTADTDVFLIPEQVLTLGLIWRFKEAKGFVYDEAFRTYQMARERYAFNDQPRPMIRMGRRLFNDGLAAGVYGDVRVIVP